MIYPLLVSAWGWWGAFALHVYTSVYVSLCIQVYVRGVSQLAYIQSHTLAASERKHLVTLGPQRLLAPDQQSYPMILL
jgi:hypothetical protein